MASNGGKEHRSERVLYPSLSGKRVCEGFSVRPPPYLRTGVLILKELISLHSIALWLRTLGLGKCQWFAQPVSGSGQVLASLGSIGHSIPSVLPSAVARNRADY